MPGGRKPSKLTQNTDTKLDGAYADLKAIPDDEYGGRAQQQAGIDAVKRETTTTTGGMPNIGEMQDVFRNTERTNEPGNALGVEQNIQMPDGTNTQILKEIIQNNYGYKVRSRF